MRAARMRGTQVSRSDSQFKLSQQEEYNGEISTIMNLLKPGVAGGAKVDHKGGRFPPAPMPDQVHAPGPAVSPHPLTQQMQPRSSSSNFEADINDDDNDDMHTSSVNGDMLFHFKSSMETPRERGEGGDQDMIDGLKGDIIALQHALHNERSRGQGQKNVVGSQFRLGKPEVRCENCANAVLMVKKGKETIRSLKLALSRLEDKYVGLRKSKTLAEEGSPAQADLHDFTVLQKRCDDYEVEVSRLRKCAKTDQYTIEQLQGLLLEWQLKDENSKIQIQGLTDANVALQAQHDDQQRLLDQLRMELGQYRMQLEAAELRLSRPAKPDIDKDALIIELKQQLHETGETRGALEARVLELEAEIARVNDRTEATQKALLDSQLVRQDQLTALEKAAKDVAGLNDAAKTLKTDLQGKERARLLLAAELHEEKGKFVELANENVALLQELARLRPLLQELEQGRDTQQHALEKAIAQSVRLCVVAPTVNVHVSDKRMKFRGGLQDDKLRAFLDSEILEKYSILFKQHDEGSAPDGVTSIQGWLQKLLGEMQKSIEGHVNNAMAGDDK
jgi:hypothetical protein